MSTSSANRLTFFATAQLFLSLSLLYGTWVLYIPHIIEKLEMSESQLGITLFFASMGALLGTFAGKPLVRKIGEGNMSFVSIVFMTFSMIGIFLAPSYFWIIVIFVFWGIGSGLFQIAANSMVTVIEEQRKITIMSSCHAFFSLGALIASGAGTILMILLDDATLHVMIAAALVLILQVGFYKHYIKNRKIKEPFQSAPKSSSKRVGLLVILAVIALIAMVSEGAIADWSGLYLKDVVHLNSNYVGLGYAGFSLAMTLARFVGDYFSKKYGAVQVILRGFIISILGFVLVLTNMGLVTILGFFIVGIGFSVIVPEAYRLSANIPHIDSASGIAFISGTSYVGFLAGPPLLGFIAESYGLSVSFISLLALVMLGTGLVFLLKFKPSTQLAKS